MEDLEEELAHLKPIKKAAQNGARRAVVGYERLAASG